MGTMQLVPYAIQGYASNFCLSILDRDWREDLTEDEAYEIVLKCINELKTRFLVNMPNWTVKKCDKDGVSVVKAPGTPLPESN